MSRSTRPPRAALALLGALAAALTLPLARPARAADDCSEAQAQSCADCCKLPCIEAEILKAKYQQEFYRQIAKRKSLTEEEYRSQESNMGKSAEAIRLASLHGLETCNYYIPKKNQCYAEQRRFTSAGFRVERDGAGLVQGTSYTVTTNLESCTANADAMALIPAVTACEGIGRATVEHENKHVADCLARLEKKQTAKLTPTQVAAGEVPGYDVEIAALEQLRLDAALACKKRSCDESKLPWDQSASTLGTLIDTIVQKGPPKPASKSPLARGGRKP